MHEQLEAARAEIRRLSDAAAEGAGAVSELDAWLRERGVSLGEWQAERREDAARVQVEMEIEEHARQMYEEYAGLRGAGRRVG